MEVTYREAGKADIDELVRLRLEYLAADFGELDTVQTDGICSVLPGYLQSHLGEDLHAEVASCDGRLVGTCWLLAVEKPASIAFPHGRTAAIYNVYVDPDYRRMGIARELMVRLIAKAEQLRLDRLELRATAMGYDLYRSIGFVDDESSHTAMNYVVGQ